MESGWNLVLWVVMVVIELGNLLEGICGRKECRSLL